MTFGVNIENVAQPNIFVDAYFGFSQRLPLPDIGIPAQLYRDLGVSQPDFDESGIIKFSSKSSTYDQEKS